MVISTLYGNDTINIKFYYLKIFKNEYFIILYNRQGKQYDWVNKRYI